jgi:23S rRNA pseudoU1915 N3-methylase RlmH
MPSPKFQPGQSGNSKGRPKGKSLKATELRKAIEAKADDILQAVIDAAVNGDMAACKMLLDRITPALKPQALSITLPVKETLPEQGSEIIKAIVTAQIAPDIGSQLITALSNQGKLVELQELAERLSRIEKKLDLQSALN